jgi:hypothetical protein
MIVMSMILKSYLTDWLSNTIYIVYMRDIFKAKPLKDTICRTELN